jgi:hypothetical protein
MTLPATFEFLALLQYYPKDRRAVQNLHTTNAQYETKNKSAKSADCKQWPKTSTTAWKNFCSGSANLPPRPQASPTQHTPTVKIQFIRSDHNSASWLENQSINHAMEF